MAGGYSTTNLVLQHSFPNGLDGFVRIENLFDREYHEFVGFPNPGLGARVGVRYRFEF
jgi:outer membrane cobalamin receptor